MYIKNGESKYMTEIINLFSIPVYRNKLNYSLKKEMPLIKKLSEQIIKNEGNDHTNDTYILNRKEFTNLKKEIQNFIDHYFKLIINPVDDAKLYITQSWINYTYKNNYHHKHCHRNSYLSGVLYISTQEEDSITFHRPDFYERILFTPKEYNHYNCLSLTVPVKNNEIVLFPSYLQHSVKNKKTDGVRISLPFNTFVKGVLGKENLINRLVL